MTSVVNVEYDLPGSNLRTYSRHVLRVSIVISKPLEDLFERDVSPTHDHARAENFVGILLLIGVDSARLVGLPYVAMMSAFSSSLLTSSKGIADNPVPFRT